tara:strand:+ start:685 stop:2241 length:1557 start_codon:yes stop_codon:yes gene_type:complete
MAKELLFEDSAHESLLVGIEILANAVKTTLGPKGKTVLIETNSPVPVITKDGVSVAKSIWLENPFENMGAQMAKDVASKTADIAGDGTTTATVLAYNIAKRGTALSKDHSSVDIKDGINEAVKDIIEKLDELKRPINGKDDIAKIATISSNNDTELGNLIADAMEQVGDDGILTIKESASNDTYLDVIEGMEFSRGYTNPTFINNAEKALVEYYNPNYLLFDGKIDTVQEALHVIKISKNKPLVIIAESFSDEALSTFIINKARNATPLVAVKAPGFGVEQNGILQDIAILTGGALISKDKGLTISDADERAFGTSKSITVSETSTVIYEGNCSDASIMKRIETLKTSIENAPTGFIAERLKDRLAKLSGGIGVIYVGGQTEAERQERKDRVDDALAATKAAISEGVVPGGGLALIRCAQILKDKEGKQPGYDLVLSCCNSPLKQIAKNSGKDADVVVTNVNEMSGTFGYNAKTDVYEDLIVAGVIDPVKVTKTALKNAASIAGLILTTDCVIVSKRN